MANDLDPKLLAALRRALLATDCFHSDDVLFALFVDARIAPWRYRCKASLNISERVNFLIDTLYNSTNTQGENALVLFLQVLTEQYPPEDAKHNEFKQLVNDLSKGLTNTLTQPINIPFINRENELEWIRQETGLTQYWNIYAPPGYGKTTFLNQIVQHYLYKNWVCAQLEISKDYTPKLRPLVETIIRVLEASQTPKEDATLKEDTTSKTFFEEDATPEHIGLELARRIIHLRVPGNSQELAMAYGSGVVLALDNMDALDDVTLEQFLKMIAEVYQHLKDGRFFANHNHFCLFMASRNPRRIAASFRHNIIIKPLGLSPYTYRYVRETIIHYALQVPITPLSEEEIQQIASKLMYCGGGHPGCIATLLIDLAREHFTGYSYVLSNEGQITEPVFKVLDDLKTTLLNQDLFPVLETLSVFRRIDRVLLTHLMDQGLIPWQETVIKLERQLSTSHLSSDNREGVFRDSITQRLFLIHLRTTRPQVFSDICKAGINFYEQRLSDRYPYAIPYALEYLHLCTHKACHIDNQCGDALQNIIAEQLETVAGWLQGVWEPDDARALIYQFGQELLVDWELEFLANYFLSPEQYQPTRFSEIVADFNQRHSAYITGEAA